MKTISRRQLRRMIAESYGDMNDPYNPLANPDLVRREMTSKGEYSTDSYDIDHETGIGEIPGEEEDAGEMARYHALNNDRDETLYRDNLDYRSAYDEINEGPENKKIEVGNQWYYGNDADFDNRWENFGEDYHDRGLLNYIDFDEDEDSDSDSDSKD